MDGASVLSIDDDQLAMRSRHTAVKMGLSHHVNPRKREGIIQVAACESLMGFFSSSHYLLRKESADRGLITALMHLKGVHFAEWLHSSPGNIITFDRGFISEDALKVASESYLGYVATVRAGRGAPFLIDKPKAGQSLLSEEGLRMFEWATRKINRREHFVCASREETANKISMVMTNIPAFGPQTVTVKPIGKSYSAIFGESSHESMCVYPLPFDEYMLHEFLRSVTHLTRNQKCPSWFCLCRLRVTSTNLFRTIRIGVIMAVFEAEDDLELLKGLGFKTMTWVDVTASQNGLSTNISQFRGKGKTEMTKLAESCGVVTDSSMTIAKISSALMKAKRQGEDNINQRREYLFAKKLISAWAMKPIRSTTAMDKGEKNEPNVIRELPAFWERWAREPSCSTLEHITEIGLVVSEANPMERTRGMEATSVDGVGVRKFRNGDVQPFLIEIKTFSSQESLRKAELVPAKHGRVSFVLLREISDRQSEKGQMVRESLLKKEYFVQVLKHAMVFHDGAASCGGNFVHATFVSTLENQVQYIVYISIGLPLLRHLRRIMAPVRNDFYPWTFKKPKEYPPFSTEQLGHARSNGNFRGSMKFTLDFVAYAVDKGGIENDHYVRPFVVPAWNAGLKNGADIYSQYLSGFKISSTRVPPASIVFFRALQSMLLNASQLFKLCRIGNGFQKFVSYTLWRHHCSTTQKFKEFQIQVITESGILGCPNPTKMFLLLEHMTPPKHQAQ